MTTGGWIFMVMSVGFVVILASWCYIQVLGGNHDSVDDS